METNAIYCGDCKDILRNFPKKSVDLIYIDPPFFTQKNYEIIWKDGSEIRSFKDAQWYSKNGKRREDIYVYIDWLKERIEECYRVLKNTGSFYIHCDYHADAYIRVYILDAIFGRNNFKNEITWQRTHAHGGGRKGFSRVHDTLFFYTKSDKFTFNRQHVPYSESYINTFFTHKEKNGRRYQLIIATGSGETKNDYTWKGVKPPKGRHWAYTKDKMKELEKKGRLVYSKRGIPRIKQYVDEKEGTLVTDIWTDIDVIHSQSKERLGYPTQKPLALLERIVNASSNPTDIVLDPMCGCGTAVVIAHKLKRRWIGIDISPTSCKLMNDRLRKYGATTKLIGMPATVKQLRKIQHFDFQNWVIERLGGRVSSKKVGDMGIDGVMFDGTPIQVKQSDKVGRNVVDNFETAIRRYYAKSLKEKKGIIVAFSFTKDAYNEIHRAKLESSLNIELKTVEELLNEK